MPAASDFSATNLPVLGSWVCVRAQGRGIRNVDRTLAATPALVTSVESDAHPSASLRDVPKWRVCVIYPNPLVLMGFGRGAPFKRVDTVPVERLRVVDSNETSRLEKAMRAAVARCASQGPGEDRFVEQCFTDIAEMGVCQQASASISHDEEDAGSLLSKSSPAAELALESEVAVESRPKALNAEANVQAELGGEVKDLFKSKETPKSSRSCGRSRSRSRSQSALHKTDFSAALTPQRRKHLGTVERTLRRVQSEEKVELPKFEPELTLKREDKAKLREFTAAVSKELSAWSNWRMEAEELIIKMTSEFSLKEVSSGLEILEAQSKIVIADQMVFAVM